MTTDVIMPQLGESIYEGTITRWLKEPGDSIGKDEPLFEISTDKVDAEIPSPAAGILSDIRCSAGTTVQVNMVVAVIDDANDAQRLIPAEHPQAAADSASRPAAPNGGTKSVSIRCSPLVRRIARENNLDLSQIERTGLDGRITKTDVLHHLSRRESEQSSGGAVTEGTTNSVATPTVVSSVRAESTRSESKIPSNRSNADELVPLTRMRAIIAQRMSESVRTSPHVHTVYKVDMTNIVRIREREKRKFEESNGVKLTYMPFIAVGAIQALRKFPIVNASLEDGSIHYHQNVNLGIAVALEWGLIVPVIKRAEERNFLGLARAIADVADRARSKRLSPDEATGSTFTLTNSGIFGEEFGTPIINQPDSAILAIGGLKKEPVIVTDSEGNDGIAIRSVQHFCLGFDHRTIDGADAGRFMAEFKKTLENWDQEI